MKTLRGILPVYSNVLFIYYRVLPYSNAVRITDNSRKNTRNGIYSNAELPPIRLDTTNTTIFAAI